MSERTYYLGRVKTILARINEIYSVPDGFANYDIGTPDYDAAWESAYEQIFSDDVALALASIFNALTWRFDYCDPDTTYEDDVVAYVTALREFCATKQAELDGAPEVPNESDLADLNWIDGPPTCEGEWLIEYTVPRASTDYHILMVKVRETLPGLEIALPPTPLYDPPLRLMTDAFPGNRDVPPHYKTREDMPPTIVKSCLIK